MPELFLTPEIEAILQIPNIVSVVNYSGGKDSDVTLHALRAYYERTQTAADIRLAWSDTGNEWTATQRWPSSEQWVIQRSADYGLPLRIVRNSKRTLQQEVVERGRFPSNGQRWCTAHHKRGPLQSYLASILTQHPEADFILSIKGIRADESDQRATNNPWEIHPDLTVKRAKHSKRPRYCFNWLPIFYWTLDDVLAYIEEHEIPLHPAYTIKNRFSCKWCIYDGPKQLTALYHHYREAFDEAHGLELQTGWTLHSSRRYLPDVVAKYEASDQQWIPETAIYATRSHACDY